MLTSDHAALIARIKKWRESDRQGYDVAIALLCEAEEALEQADQDNARWEADLVAMCDNRDKQLARAEQAERERDDEHQLRVAAEAAMTDWQGRAEARELERDGARAQIVALERECKQRLDLLCEETRVTSQIAYALGISLYPEVDLAAEVGKKLNVEKARAEQAERERDGAKREAYCEHCGGDGFIVQLGVLAPDAEPEPVQVQCRCGGATYKDRLEVVERERDEIQETLTQAEHNAAIVYCHITNNQISKINTAPEVVKAVADDCITKIVDEETAEVRAENARREDVLRQLVKDGRLWIDQQDLQAARVRLVYEDGHQSYVARLREALETMLKSARPHPELHPTMTAAWKLARAALRGEGETGAKA